MLSWRTHHYVMMVSLFTSYYDGSVSFSDVQVHLHHFVLTFSTRSGFCLVIHKAMLPRTHFISTDATFCTALASHVHTLGPPQGPTYLSLGHTLSILVSTNNVSNANDARVFTILCTLHHYLPILGLARGIGHGISIAMPC